mgnify:CR=1 FL=1
MELNAYFKSLVDQDRAAVVICDLEHTIIYMNPAAIASYAKHGGAALLGKSVLTCHNPQSRQTIQRQISTQLKTGNAATDSFVSSVIAALNQYTVDLAKEQIRLAFAQAQKEVDDLHQRTREGILTARLNGKQIGQTPGRKLNIKKSAPCKEQIKKYSRNFDGTLTDAECIKLIGIARNTYYKYKRELLDKI